jgi:hypothetical protein
LLESISTKAAQKQHKNNEINEINEINENHSMNGESSFTADSPSSNRRPKRKL